MLIGVSKSKKKGYVDVTVGKDIKFTLSASNAGALGIKLQNCSNSIFFDKKKSYTLVGDQKTKSYAKDNLMRYKAETEAIKHMFKEHLFVPMYNEFINLILTEPNKRNSTRKPSPTKPPTDGKQLY